MLMDVVTIIDHNNKSQRRIGTHVKSIKDFV